MSARSLDGQGSAVGVMKRRAGFETMGVVGDDDDVDLTRKTVRLTDLSGKKHAGQVSSPPPRP